MNALLVEPARPRLPLELQRALSRLAAGAHRFHRWAHHPLCSAYRGEVIAVGHRVRVCRGCAYVALGLLSGLGVATVTMPGAVALALIAGAALLALGSMRVRLPKWLGRFVPAVMLGAAVGGGWAAALASVAVVAASAVAYRGRQPNRAPCSNCPQRSLKICEGIAPIVKRERAVMRRSAILLLEGEGAPKGRMRA